MRDITVKLLAIVIITLITTIATLQMYNMNRVLVYSSSMATVYYEPKLLGGTILELGLDGFNGIVAVKLYAPTTRGFEMIGGGSGIGGVEVDISKYIREAWNHTKSLGWSPDRAGPSLLALILMAEEDKDKRLINITTQAITIPIIPEKAEDKKIRVDVKPSPLKLVTIKAKPGITIKAPPDRIGEICTYYPGPGGGYECYYWQLNQTLYQSTQGIPILMTSITGTDGENIYLVNHEIVIDMTEAEAEYFSVNMGLQYQTPAGISLEIPGPAFTIYRINDVARDKLFALNCYYQNQYLVDLQSACFYMGTPLDGIQEFNRDAVILSGFIGDYAVSEYLYMREECYSYGCRVSYLNISSIVVWLAPVANPDTEDIYPWHFIDDIISDGNGFDVLVDILSEDTESMYYATFYGGGFTVYADDFMIHANSSPKLGLAVPLGALASLIWNPPLGITVVLSLLVVGLEYGEVSITQYHTLSSVSVLTVDNASFHVEYYKINNYYIYSENAEYPAIIMLVKPNVS